MTKINEYLNFSISVEKSQENKIHLKKSKQFGKTREKYSGNLKDKKITIFSGKSRAVSWWKQTICTKNKSNTDFGMAIAYINKCLS
ncbi:MAG: hypothetical protein HFG62_00340 [Lachnospiraceae bacterium]|nr:hypothetical protein [Lachnospiraceae bacterium]